MGLVVSFTKTGWTEEEGLICYLKFDEGSGKIAKDSSGNNNNGKIIGGATYVKEKYGFALSFNGINGYVDCGHHASLETSNAITMEAWIYSKKLWSHEDILCKGEQYILRLNSNEIQSYIFTDKYYYSNTISNQIEVNKWYHVAMTYDTSSSTRKIRIFINGRESKYKRQAVIPPGEMKTGHPSDLQIGRAKWSGGCNYFNGIIAEVRIYNRALTDTEIKSHYKEREYSEQLVKSEIKEILSSRQPSVTDASHTLIYLSSQGEKNEFHNRIASRDGNHGLVTKGTWGTGIFGSAIQIDEDTPAKRWVVAKERTSPIKSDGRLDEKAWQEGGKLVGFIVVNTPTFPYEWQTEAHLTYDHTNLYLGIKCYEPEIEKIKPLTLTLKQWSKGDNIEFFIEPKGRPYYQFVFNAKGEKFDGIGHDDTKDTVWKVVASKDKEKWSAEVKIPFESLGAKPAPGDVWRMNVFRSRLIEGSINEYGSWSPHMGHFHDTTQYGYLCFSHRRENSKPSLSFRLDRKVYDTLDRSAGMLLEVKGIWEKEAGEKIIWRLVDKEGKRQISEATMPVIRSGTYDVDINIEGIPSGDYKIEAFVEKGGEQLYFHCEDFQIRKGIRKKGFEVISLTLKNEKGEIAVDTLAGSPQTVGIPLAKGVLYDEDMVKLVDSQGKELPIQSYAAARWDKHGSIKWLLCDFFTRLGEYKYYLYTKKRHSPYSGKKIETKEQEDVFQIDTGKALFIISKKQGVILKEAYLDKDGDGNYTSMEKIITGIEPYLKTKTGERYSGCYATNPVITTEQSGPLRSTIKIENFYYSEKQDKFIGQHRTRLFFYAEKPYIKIFHTWVNTEGSEETIYDDIGLRINMPSASGMSLPLEEGKYYYDELYRDNPRYLLQDTPYHFSLMGKYRAYYDKERKWRWTELTCGSQFKGWVDMRGRTCAITLGIEDFWQNFPKQITMEADSLTFHIWPKNGRNIEREITDANICHLWFVHQGKYLNFQVPKEYYSFEGAHPKRGYGYIRGSQYANAIGSAKSHTLWLRLHSPEEQTKKIDIHISQLLNLPVCALAGKTMARSGVFGRLHQQDPKRFFYTEQALEQGFQAEMRLNRLNQDYGMFIFGGAHSKWEYQNRAWHIYRTWQNTHHAGPRTSWLLYFRSGDPQYFEYALRNTQKVLDLGYCHYTKPKYLRLSYPQGKIVGGLNDYKGLVPWNAGNRVADYNSMTDFMFYYYYTTGNKWGLEVAKEWGEAMKKTGGLQRHRAGAGSLTALLNLYQATWDKGYLKKIWRCYSGLVSSQQKDGSFPIWEGYAPWLETYWEFTKDKDAEVAIKRWADAYMRGYGDDTSAWCEATGPLNILAYAYFITGNPKYAKRGAGLLKYIYNSIYKDPFSIYDGMLCKSCGNGFFTPYIHRACYMMEAISQCKDTISPDYPPFEMRSAPLESGKQGFIIYLKKEYQNKPIQIFIKKLLKVRQKKYALQLHIQIKSPGGKTIFEREQKYQTNYKGVSILDEFTIPASREKGTYKVTISREGRFSLLFPLTDGKEVLYQPDKKIELFRLGQYAFYVPSKLKELHIMLDGRAWAQSASVYQPNGKLAKKISWPGDRGSDIRILKLKITQPGIWSIFGDLQKGIKAELRNKEIPPYFSLSKEQFFLPDN